MDMLTRLAEDTVDKEKKKKKRVNGQTFINSAIHSATDDKAVRVKSEAISYRASFSSETFCMVLFAISISLFPWKGGGS